MGQELQKQDNDSIVIRWKRESKSISLIGDRATTIEKAFDSPQISLLKKEEQKTLGANVVLLMMELSQFAPTAWTSDTIAPLAKTLIESFWMLRFDELIYVFRKGINGGFGKIYGTIHYTELTRWLSEYLEGERADYCEENQKIKHVEVNHNNLASIEDIRKLVNKFKVDEKKEIDKNKRSLTLEFYDYQTHDFFLAHKDELTHNEIMQIKVDSLKRGFTKSIIVINAELLKREENEH